MTRNSKHGLPRHEKNARFFPVGTCTSLSMNDNVFLIFSAETEVPGRILIESFAVFAMNSDNAPVISTVNFSLSTQKVRIV